MPWVAQGQAAWRHASASRRLLSVHVAIGNRTKGEKRPACLRFQVTNLSSPAVHRQRKNCYPKARYAAGMIYRSFREDSLALPHAPRLRPALQQHFGRSAICNPF
jgi:hypothetical protein